MAQEDPFRSTARGLDSPGAKHFSITPLDGVDIPVRPRVLYFNSAGTVAVRDEAGGIVSYNVSAGQLLPFSAVGIEATGTTATVVGWV